MSQPVTSAASNTADPIADGGPFGQQPVALTSSMQAFLRTLCRGGAGNGTGVDDLVQETMARAWRSRATFDADTGTPAAEESASRQATPPSTRLRARELAADPRRIHRFASGQRLRPDRESTHWIGARPVTQTPRSLRRVPGVSRSPRAQRATALAGR
jgi:hypothetical protein